MTTWTPGDAYPSRPAPGASWAGGAAKRWDGWRDRVYRQAAKAAEPAVDARPRDLRGSFASLLIAAGQSVLEVARQLGH